MVQAEVLERAEGIKREYNELDTVWFMAGSLFQVFDHYICYLRLRLFFFILIYGILNSGSGFTSCDLCFAAIPI